MLGIGKMVVEGLLGSTIEGRVIEELKDGAPASSRRRVLRQRRKVYSSKTTVRATKIWPVLGSR